MQGFFNICKSISVIHHINKLNKNHMIISIDAEKAFDKIQHLFMMKTLQKVGIEGTYLQSLFSSFRFPNLFVSLKLWKRKMLPHLSLSNSNTCITSLVLPSPYRRSTVLHPNPTIDLCPQSHFLQLSPEPAFLNYLLSGILSLFATHHHSPFSFCLKYAPTILKETKTESSVYSVIPLRTSLASLLQS